VYGYPADEAAEIALATVRDELSAHDFPERVVMCMFGAEAAHIMRATFERLKPA
jgi:O-acetyl-ADP-ribose deacetylase (regulator of RNase III)